MRVTDQAEAVPAPGQLVTVRNRQWVAAEILRGEVASSDPHVFAGSAPHLVTLASIEDDARDEELRVVWELETGAVVHDSTILPSPEQGFDDPTELASFLHAVRWGAIASADNTALQAPFRSGIQIEDYQLDPVVRALSMPRTNLLIADDVGLGKTIEAGLVMQELFLRHRARSMMIVCPAGLTIQWRDEMREKFGLEFRIVDRDLLMKLRRQRGLYVNPWTHYPRLIVSVDWLKRPRPMKLLREVLPSTPRYPRAIDLLVVDEVHSCAPSGHGQYAVDSLRTKAIRALAPHCEHRLFLSATPHNGYLESFTALLEMLDDQRFARGVKPAEEQLAKIMVRRLKRDLPKKWDGSSRFGQRDLDYLEVTYSEDEREAHTLLGEYAESRRITAEVDKSSKSAADFVTTLLKRRMFSSPRALGQTVAKHLETMSGREKPDREVGQLMLRPSIERFDEKSENDSAYADAEMEVLSAVRGCAPPLTVAERSMLDRLAAWAEVAQDRPEAKVTALLQWLDPIVRPGGDWSEERIIVFTEYRDTQQWLYERLLASGYPKERLALLYGGQDEKEREKIKDRFTAEPALDDLRILIGTDAASEGINLQWHCHRVLHWEIPWNPNRLEQRNGRVDRHGQRATEVEIRHFVPAGWKMANFGEGSLEDELDFLRIAVEKVEKIREDLGSAGEVISSQVERKMLGHQTEWLMVDSEIAQRASRARLKVERDLARDLERLTERLAGSRTQLDLTPETVEQVVRTALKLAHGRDLRSATAPEGFGAPVFRLPELPGAWATARNAGLYHPLTGKERLVTFDQDAVAGRTDVVLLHLGHQLVQMCLRLLRAELWAQARGAGIRGKLSRVTARVVPGDLLRTPAVVAHGRVVVTGAEGTRLHEEVIAAGGLIEGGQLRRVNTDEVTAWLSAASSEQVPEDVRETLVGLWPELSDPLAKLLARRAADRSRSTAALLRKRCDEEVDGINVVLDELQRSIQEALGATEHWQQGSLFESLFDGDERNQLRTDHEALLSRLEAIPDQREDETKALQNRYANPVPRWFPVAVEFLVPASIIKGAH